MKNRNKNPFFPLLLSIVLLYFSISRWTETERILNILFDSTPSFLQSYFTHRPQDFIYPASLLFGAIFLFLAFRRIFKNNKHTEGSLTKKSDHTHNRADTVAYDRNESVHDHYIKQLDGFLKAGIIDRAEYNHLVRRYQK